MDTEDAKICVGYENICKENIFNFILQVEDNSVNEYLISFKILYNYVQTVHKNVITTFGFMCGVTQDFKQIIIIVNCLCWHLNGCSAWSGHLNLQYTIFLVFVNIYVYLYLLTTMCGIHKAVSLKFKC